jgi:hypothetical protein
MVNAELAVQALVAEDVSLGEIEEYVDELPLDDEHKSALWLLAWSHTTRRGGGTAAEPRAQVDRASPRAPAPPQPVNRR